MSPSDLESVEVGVVEQSGAMHDETKKTFRPYTGTTIDAPFFHLLIKPVLSALQPVLATIFAVRWQLSRPLQIRVFPKYFPLVDYPVLRDLPFLTVGQLLLGLPLVILLLSGYYFAFVAPDVKRTGHLAAYAIYATFLTANKSNSLTAFFFGIPFERMISFHNFASTTTVILSCFHGYAAYAYEEGVDDDGGLSDSRLDSDDSEYGLLGPNPNLGKFLFDGTHNTSGSLMVIAILTLWTSSSLPILRRKFFDIWLWTHISAAICVIIFAVIHHVTAILFVGGWWAIDLLMRYVIMAGCQYPRRANLELVTDDVVKVSFEKPEGFSYNGGQFVQIAFPDLGIFAFHPISISSAPHEPLVTLHVRSLGGWSERLVNLAKEKDEVSILVEGPYGSLSMDIDDDSRYKMVLLVCGGIGVTHCNSVAKSIINDNKNGRKLKHLRFVWAMREAEMLRAMDPLESSASIEKTQREGLDLSEHSIVEAPMKALVETDVFLTKSTPKDPVTLEDGRNVYFGRPDISGIVADMKEKALYRKVSHVAVFVCGPQALVDGVKDVCRRKSQKVADMTGVTFDVHEEIFNY